jgi:hypothetical protein
MSEELKVVTTVTTEPEADLILERLKEAGINAIAQRTIGGPEFGFSGARAVMVREADLARAHSVLEQDEGEFSDEELTRLSEEAGREAGKD